MKKRITALLMALIMCFSTLTTSVTTVNAAGVHHHEVLAEKQLPMPKESDYVNTPTERSLATKVIKEAIEFIIKHGDDAAKVVAKVSGKTVSKNFLKHYSKVTKALKPLLKWSEIPKQAVYDAVFRGLYNAGVSRKVATNIALAIKEGLGWFI